ncbi:MAG: V-type ATP synthase subunit I [Ruminococcaceae bacterium]|nr:V-type ATP synthase subunit I [Oscillospiraceae bacterium]
MAVVKMKKLAVFAHERDADALLRRLMRLRCVELKRSDTGEGEDELSLIRDDGRCAEIEKNISRITEALSVLSKYSTRKKGLGSSKVSVRLDKFRTDGSYARANGIVSETLDITGRLSAIKNEEAKQTSLLKSLSVWRGYDLPLDFEGTERTVVVNVTLPTSVTGARIDDALGDTAACAVKVGEDKSTACYALICHKGEEDEAQRKLSALGMLKAPLDGFGGTAAHSYSVTKKKLEKLEAEKNALDERLRALASDIELLEILYDAEGTSLAAERGKENFAKTELCVLLCGWVPENEEKRVCAVLSKFGCAYEIEEPNEDEEPPVLLKNNFFATTFEWVLGMYSYPKYGTYDPTFIMSIFYFIIFGLMFADVGYGFILTVAGFGAILLLNPGKGMRNFLAMFGYCGISSMIMGVLFGAYFGNLPQVFSENMLGVEGASLSMQTAVLFDPLNDPMSFLIISLGVGAVHMIAGMAVQFYVLCKKGQAVTALCDIATWWLTFLGIGLAVLFPWGIYVAIAGVLSLILTQGRHEKSIIMKIAKGVMSLYGSINYISDLLSYSRILALGLAAGVIAQVINVMGTMGGPSFVGFIMMVLVFIVGHLLNLAINVLGTFVHTSRLQYIEFFGKFYEDGGKPFTPAVPSDKYTTEQ